MITIKHTITDIAGLHARPAVILAEKAGAFAADITVCCNGVSTDGMDPIALMQLNALHGDELAITITGEDEREAARCLRALLEGFV